MSHSGWADTGLGVRWYGERGVLNALVAHMQRSHDSVESVRALLRAVRWADPQARLWLDTFTRATVLVEIGLADFGNPDLMIVCDGGEGVHCVFLEAKVTTYLASMRPNHRGMTLPGFNSSINGQLSLKYRFARSLRAASANGSEVAEAETQLQAYANRQSDTRTLPRRLAKGTIVALFGELGLLGLPESRCEYVALTWDVLERAFFTDQVVKRMDGLPVFLGNSGDDVWEDTAPRVGWLGYGELESALDLGRNHEYQAARAMMMGGSVPPATEYEATLGNLREGLAEVVPLMDQLAELFEGYEVAKYVGSYSVRDQGRTIAKLMPHGGGVFVGIRDSKKPERWFSGALQSVFIQGVVFRGVVVPADSREQADAELLVRGLGAE